MAGSTNIYRQRTNGNRTGLLVKKSAPHRRVRLLRQACGAQALAELRQNRFIPIGYLRSIGRDREVWVEQQYLCRCGFSLLLATQITADRREPEVARYKIWSELERSLEVLDRLLVAAQQALAVGE